MTDYGTTKQVELTAGYDQKNPHYAAFNWRMSIDNPPAAAFFKPGQGGYWLAFYDADRFSYSEALAHAHT